MAERLGSASAVHARFMQWEQAGLFETLSESGLTEYDELQGIAWEWQSIDGIMMKAPLAQDSVRTNPTDRGKKWGQATLFFEYAWRTAFDRRERCLTA